MGNRQHRDPGFGIVIPAVDSQRPKMRRGPGKDQHHQQQGVRIKLAGNRGPAQQRRSRSCQTTNHDILRGRMFKPHGIDHRIANQAGEGQPGRQGV